MIRTKGVLHFTISVSNPDASEKFYQDVLGLQTIQNVRPTGMVFMKSSDDFVILTKSETPVRPNLDDNFNVHHAFVVDVDQYEIAKQHVIDCGIKIIFEEERREGVFMEGNSTSMILTETFSKSLRWSKSLMALS